VRRDPKSVRNALIGIRADVMSTRSGIFRFAARKRWADALELLLLIAAKQPDQF
jgi:hypothetical protein